MTAVMTDLSRSGKLSVLHGMSVLLTYHGWQLWPRHRLSSQHSVSHWTPADMRSWTKMWQPEVTKSDFIYLWKHQAPVRQVFRWGRYHKDSLNPRGSHPQKSLTQSFVDCLVWMCEMYYCNFTVNYWLTIRVNSQLNTVIITHLFLNHSIFFYNENTTFYCEIT